MSLEIKPGVYISTRAEIIAEQKEWLDTDMEKNRDFTMYEFWITTDLRTMPKGVRSVKEALEELYLD